MSKVEGELQQASAHTKRLVDDRGLEPCLYNDKAGKNDDVLGKEEKTSAKRRGNGALSFMEVVKKDSAAKRRWQQAKCATSESDPGCLPSPPPAANFLSPGADQDESNHCSYGQERSTGAS
ncbi:hypothetical protein EPUS_02686 [Endocarpon pusillum Z07020]|uniref:Uncharacterized protein n=1 Tax=Endocarpon pusillum (strain Z07020 / HMAS-L-300199) TaxID=1263415 RepID=U1GWU8_ENDPU|nr:uncharacterized protein EPUS_02686 [Endocarpon pusillum Z07020]ERF76973.1 hypothetical protein EPUS_02686 [Endocarpon pusillum Z07020]